MWKPKPPVVPVSSLYVNDIACDFTCSWGPIKKKKKKKLKSHNGLIFLIELVDEISIFLKS